MENHAVADELLVGFHKVGTGRGGLTYKQAVDEALCSGWIDARRQGGGETWSIRFTPRKSKSIWSAVNIARIAELATIVNERAENIGARRLHTVMERLLDEVSFHASELDGQSIAIDRAYVDGHLGELVQDPDLSRYIL